MQHNHRPLGKKQVRESRRVSFKSISPRAFGRRTCGVHPVHSLGSSVRGGEVGLQVCPLPGPLFADPYHSLDGHFTVYQQESFE